MSKYTLGKVFHYWVEVLNAEDDRLSLAKVFKTPADVHEWCLNRLVQLDNAHRIQVWFGSTNPDNPDPDRDWVNSYCREPFSEFGKEALRINRSSRVTRITARGEVFIDNVELPPVYAQSGNWHRSTIKQGKKRKQRQINLEEIAG